MITIFERYSDRARRVIVVAQEEARAMRHLQIGTEHLLLGLIRCEGIAGEVLGVPEMEPGAVREAIGEFCGKGLYDPPPNIPFSSRAKKVCELALREALQLGHNYIGTEHILLAMIRESGGYGCKILSSWKPLKEIRKDVHRLLGTKLEQASRPKLTLVTDEVPTGIEAGEAVLSLPDLIDQLEVRLRIAEQMLGLR